MGTKDYSTCRRNKVQALTVVRGKRTANQERKDDHNRASDLLFNGLYFR